MQVIWANREMKYFCKEGLRIRANQLEPILSFRVWCSAQNCFRFCRLAPSRNDGVFDCCAKGSFQPAFLLAMERSIER